MKLINKIMEGFLMLLIVAMVLFALWQVATRFILGNPSSFTEELLIYMLVWLTMVGGAYTYGQNSHIAIAYLFKKFNKNNQLSLNIVINTLVLIFAFLVLIFGGGSLTISSLSRATASLGVSYAVVYVSTVISGVMFIIYALIFIREDYKVLRNGEINE